MRLSVVIPIYNESENIPLLSQKIEAAMQALQPESWEAIFVNDGSSDGSKDILNDLCANPYFKALHFTSNQGQTAAIDAGIRVAEGDYVVTMDGDLQNDPTDIAKLLPLMEPGVGCVAGFREKREDSWLRRLSSIIANWVRNQISQENIRDTGCSLKIFRKSVLDRIKLFEGLHRFLPTLVKMEGYRVIEVPVSHHPRQAGESKYGVWNRLFKSFRDLLAVRWMKKRMLQYELCETKGDKNE